MIELSPAEIALYYSAALPELAQRGHQWRGRCPIHQGGGISFSVDPETGRCYCFSQCGRGWDIVGFEREFTGVGFREAVQAISDVIGRELSRGLWESPVPKCSSEEIATAELCRAGLRWRIERGLAAAKAELFGPRHEEGASATRRLTQHLQWIEGWTFREAVALAELLDPVLVRQCIEEAREAQLELAAILVALSGQTEGKA